MCAGGGVVFAGGGGGIYIACNKHSVSISVRILFVILRIASLADMLALGIDMSQG